MKSVHQYSIQVSKRVFWCGESGLAICPDPIPARQATDEFGFGLVLVHALVVDGVKDSFGLQVRFLQICRVENPVSPYEMLARIWATRVFDALPGTLKVGRNIDRAMPQLRQDIERLGIEYVVAESSDRSFNANVSVAGKDSFFDFFAPAGEHPDQEILTEELVNQNKLRHASWRSEGAGVELPPSEQDYTSVDWAADWTLVGQKAVPPVLGTIRIDPAEPFRIAEGGPPLFRSPVIVVDEEIDQALDNPWIAGIQEYAKVLLACWPHPATTVAKTIGISKKQLDRFLRGKELPETDVLVKLAAYLSIGEGAGWSNSEVAPLGAYLLLPTKQKDAVQVYDELSHGGDLDISMEIVPESAPADPSWRYLLFAECMTFPSVMMMPRGSEVAELLDYPRDPRTRYLSSPLLNCDGTRAVPNAFYRDVQRVCGQICHQARGERDDRLEALWRTHADYLESLREFGR